MASLLQTCPKMDPRGAKRAQDGPRKGSHVYDPRIYPVIAFTFGDNFGAVLGHFGASGANVGVSQGALGVDVGAARG